MKIRNKLTYQFIVIVAVILFTTSLAIYLFSSDYRKNDFYERLLQKGSSTAKLLIEVDEIDADLLFNLELNNPMGLPFETISIYDYKNDLLFSTDEDGILGTDTVLLDEIRLDNEIRYKIKKHEILGFLYTDKYNRFVVLVGAVDIHGIRKLDNLRNVLLIVFGIGIILVFISGWLFAGKALEPISRVIEEVDRISFSSINLRVGEGNGKDEIAELAITFNRMLDRLEMAFKMQKNFIANASHELRTPLTAITGQMEVVLLKRRNPQEYEQSLTSVYEDIRNLNNLANRLLQLAQASSEVEESSFTDIRVDELIVQSASLLKSRNQEYQLTLNIGDTLTEEEDFTIRGNEQLLLTAFLNLVDNACKYSDDHTVGVFIGKTEHYLEIVFSDQGIGIPDSDLDKIFEPFHRGNNSINHKGHGIGLSLVDKIIKMHQGQIHV